MVMAMSDIISKHGNGKIQSMANGFQLQEETDPNSLQKQCLNKNFEYGHGDGEIIRMVLSASDGFV